MWKPMLAGVVAISALVVVSVAVILVVTGEERPRTAANRTAEPTLGGDGDGSQPWPREPAPAPSGLTFGEPPAEPPPPRGPMTLPPPPPPKDSWEAVPITGRAKSLGRVGGQLLARLNDLHDEITTCFTAEAQATRGSGVVTMVRDALPMDDSGGIVLVLQLESQQDGFRVVDAPVETRGPAGDELLACAQSILRGKVLETPGAVPGKRHRLLFPLVP